MKIIPQPIVFEWDKGNLNKNFVLHKVTNQEAEEVFFDEQVTIFSDDKRSASEKRYMIWGSTNRGRMLAVIFTIRKDNIRVISARDLHRKERKHYEKFKENSEI
ncbi:MAG: BrnT family toxin [Elusimicrobia bacterium]|nr:BrnT family toxin [Elusimicrobiota bacterium]